MKKYLKALILVLFINTIAIGQNDCSEAIIVCGNSGYQDLTVTGIGTQELNNLSNTCSGEEHNSIWFKLIIKNGGTLGFTLTPSSTAIDEDFDFFIFGPNATCNNLGQAIRCSTTNPLASGQADNLTGMNATATDTSEGPGQDGNSFVKWLNVQDNETYFLVVDRPIGNSNFNLKWIGTATFPEQPTFNTPAGTSLDIEQCDIDGNLDNITSFDLTVNNSTAIGTQNNVIPSYYTSNNNALLGTNPIPDYTNFNNTVNPQKIYMRLTNSLTGCFSVSDFLVNVKQGLAFNNANNLEECDTDDDGFCTFNLSDNNTINPDLINNTISYFSSKTDANSNNISNQLPINYTNKIANTSEDIWARIENTTTGCFSTTSFKIIINKLPTIEPQFTLKQCDEDGLADGFTDFNLHEADKFITLGDNSLTVTYFANANNANTGTPEITASPHNNSLLSTVYARVENTNGCYRVSQVDLLVSTTRFLQGYLKELNECDDDNTIDGLRLFDLNLASNDIINQFPTGQNLKVHYYKNLNDAQLETNEIPSNVPYMSEKPDNQMLYVRVESLDNGACFGIGQHLSLTVHPRPEFEVVKTAFVCLNLPPTKLEVFNAKDTYKYTWTDENGNEISNQPFANVSKGGRYTVIAESSSSCYSFPQTIQVKESIISNITSNDVTVTDDSENNSITIHKNNIGIGNYEFALDNSNGTYQDDPFFENVTPGIHVIYVKDKNTCGIASLEVSIIGYPKFFTPNGDGHNDTWKVLGVNENFYANSNILIFDRFGKLITKIDPKSNGWDGFYNGNKLPATDYWFSVELIDENNNVKLKTGHFSLIRR